MRWLIMACAMIFAKANCACGLQETRIIALVDSAAALSEAVSGSGLATFRSVVDSQNYREMGLDSLADTQFVAVGKPLVDFYVRLSDLRSYQPPRDPSGLLRGGHWIVYPVELRGETRSFFTLVRHGTSAQGASYGGSGSARVVAKAMREAADHHLTPPSGRYFLVRALALNVTFVGFYNRHELELIPLIDDPRKGWKVGVPRSAASVFTQLSNDARVVSDTAPR